MSEIAKFSATETLRDGRRVEIRALRHEDRTGLEDAVRRASAEVPPPPFLCGKTPFFRQEMEFFSDIDLSAM